MDHNGKGKKPTIGSERGWAGNPPEQLPYDRKKIPRWRRKVLSGSDWPDAVSFDANHEPEQIFDFKFKCPSAKYKGDPAWGKKSDGRSQEEAYRALTRKWGKDPEEFPPTKICNTNCP
jgi:hypothetical protein